MQNDLFLAEDGRLRPVWRFLASLLVFYLARSTAPLVTLLLRNRSFITQQAVARTLLVLLLVGGFSLLLITLDRIHGSPLAAMGLAFRKPALLDAVVGICFGSAIVALAVLAIRVWGQISFEVTATPAILRRLVLVTILLAVAAMAEEVPFRGYPFQRLIEAIGAIAAVIFTSVFFAAQHLGNPHATLFSTLNTAAVGVLLALAYLKTKSLWLPWGLHFGWNFTLGVGFGLPVSGITGLAVLVHGTAIGPRWLTGGDYGIEASAVATVVILLGILALAFLVPTRPAPNDVRPSRNPDHP